MDKKRSINTGNKRILEIAIPSIISNITVPLLGLIDVTIVGHLGSAAYIGAIAIGGMLFNIIYWIFGFSAYGNKRNDLASLRATQFGRSYPLIVTICRHRIADCALPATTPISHTKNSFYPYHYYP